MPKNVKVSPTASVNTNDDLFLKGIYQVKILNVRDEKIQDEESKKDLEFKVVTCGFMDLFYKKDIWIQKENFEQFKDKLSIGEVKFIEFAFNIEKRNGKLFISQVL